MSHDDLDHSLRGHLSDEAIEAWARNAQRSHIDIEAHQQRNPLQALHLISCEECEAALEARIHSHQTNVENLDRHLTKTEITVLAALALGQLDLDPTHCAIIHHPLACRSCGYKVQRAVRRRQKRSPS